MRPRVAEVEPPVAQVRDVDVGVGADRPAALAEAGVNASSASERVAGIEIIVEIRKVGTGGVEPEGGIVAAQERAESKPASSRRSPIRVAP